MNAFTWSAEKCVCSSDMSTLSSQVPSCISCQMPALLQRLNRPNLLCLLSRVSRTPFTTTPSDIFSPTNLPSNVFQITLLCLTQWLKTQQESRVRLARWCGDCNMTSPSRRPEDSCGPYRMINGRLCVGGAAVCRVLRQTQLSLSKIEMGFTYCMFICSATWNIWCLRVQLFNLESDDRRYYVTQILWRLRSSSTQQQRHCTDEISQDLPVHVRKQ